MRAKLGQLFAWWGTFVAAGRDNTIVLAVALHCGIALIAALGQIDRILQAMHASGGASYGIGSLSGSVISWPRDPDRVGAIATTWFENRAADFTQPATLVGAYVVIDLLFIFAYCWVLAVVLSRLSVWLTKPKAETTTPTTKLQTRMSGSNAIQITGYAVLVLAAADIAEGVLQVLVAANCISEKPAGGCASGWLSWAFYVITTVKWLIFAAVVITIVFGFFALASLQRPHVRALGRVLLRLRTPVALVVALGFAYVVKASPFADQAADLLRRWKHDELHAVFAAALTIVLAGVILTCARGLVTDTRAEHATHVHSNALWAAAGGTLVVGILAVVVWPHAPGLIALALILIALAATNTLTGSVSDDAPKPAAGTFGSSAVPALLGAAPLVVLGLALQSAALVEVAWAGREDYVPWLLGGLLLQAIGARAYHMFVRATGGVSPVLVAFGVCAVVLIAVFTWVDPWSVSEAVGGAGILATFAVAVALLGYGLGHVAEVTVPPRSLRMLGFRRTPFLLLLVLWGIAAATLDKGGFHDARLLGTPQAQEPRHGLTLSTLFRRWRAAQGLPDPKGSGAARPEEVSTVTPLVLVSASGGGIRAAYWTANTLECLFGGHEDGEDELCAGKAPKHTRVLAASGVSGGSLGVTAWRTHQLTPDTDDWIDHLKADVLTPTVAWALFVDLPNSLLHTEHLPDRAEMLERSWEREWLDDKPRDAEELDEHSPLAKGLFATGGQPPLLMLNGTAVESGCRFNVSVLRANVDQKRRGSTAIEDCLSVRGFEPDPDGRTDTLHAAREQWALGASVDANEFLCKGTDLRLSTAALLSARFPYVSPSGRLTACASDPNVSTYVVDGGYFDSSAAETSAQLWTALEPIVERYNADTGQCIMPFAIQIDNGYDEPPGPDPEKRPLESMAPLKTVLGSRDAREADARQTLALAVSKPVGGISHVNDSDGVELRRYAHIYPRAHPGTQAPLGWALSESTQSDLTSQLHAEPNATAVGVVRDTWLRPDHLRCGRSQRTR